MRSSPAGGRATWCPGGGRKEQGRRRHRYEGLHAPLKQTWFILWMMMDTYMYMYVNTQTCRHTHSYLIKPPTCLCPASWEDRQILGTSPLIGVTLQFTISPDSLCWPSDSWWAPGIQPESPALAGRFFTTEPPGKPLSTPQFSSVAQSCPTLCEPTNRSIPGLPVHHQLPESTQTHVHWIGDAIQPSHLLSSPSPPAPNPSQHQGLFQWVNSSHEVAKVLEFQLHHQFLQWTPRTDIL